MPALARTLAAVRAHLRRHGEWWWAPLAYALVVAWIYRGLWSSHGVPTGLGWDTIDTHGPDLDFFARDLREGRFSLWNPYDKGGYPVVADPVFARYYPFAWPFAAWGAAFGSAWGASWWLVQLLVLGHHVVAGAAMHLFLRTRGLSPRAALVGGVGLVASSPLLVHKASNVLWPLAWVPLVWVALDAALARPGWRRGVGVAAAFGLCATAGSPPGMFYAALLIGPYGAWRLVAALRDPARRRWPAVRALLVAAAAAAAVLAPVLAITIVPARELVALASRGAQKGADFALALSLPGGPAARGVIARAAGLFEIYLGVALVLLAALAVVVRPRRDQGAAVLLAGLAALGVVLATGSNGKALPWLVAHAPGFGLLRVPGRYKLLAAWATAAGAGYGAAALEEARGRLAWRAAAVAAGVVALVAWLVVRHGAPASPSSRPAWWSIAAAGVAAGLVLVAVAPWARARRAAAAGLVLAVLVDAPLFLFLPTQGPAAEPRQRHAGDAAVVRRLDGARDRWRIYDEFVLGERAGARLRLRDLRGYPAVDPLSQARYVDVLELARRAPGILADLNVRWVLHRPHWRYGDGAGFVRLPDPRFVDRGGGLFEALHPAPLVAWYGAAQVVPAARALAAVRAVEEADGQRRRVVLEPDQAARLPAALERALRAAPPASAEGTLRAYAPDEIAVAVDAPAPGVVVLNEVSYPGWRVEVDGVPATPLRANYLLRGVAVAAGHHEVRWWFDPPGWRPRLAAYLAALLAMLAAAAWPRRRAPRVTAPAAA